MADAMTKLTRDKFIPFLDTARDLTFATSTWKRIDYSTIFELVCKWKASSILSLFEKVYKHFSSTLSRRNVFAVLYLSKERQKVMCFFALLRE